MQTGHIDLPPALRTGSSRGRVTVADFAEIYAYGYGLFIQADPRFGTLAGHPGGYPGYGSQMLWHLDSGIGVILLANGRYASPWVVANRILPVLLEDAGAVGWSFAPWPELEPARQAITAALVAGADPYALDLWSFNVDLDDPLDHRRAELAKLLDRLGPVAADAAERGSVTPGETPAHVFWTLPCERGSLNLEIRLNPAHPPRVQTFNVAERAALSADDVITVTSGSRWV